MPLHGRHRVFVGIVYFWTSAVGVDKGGTVIAPPETFRIAHRRVACDGSGDVPAALGHPRVWLEIDERGFVDCGYCDRRFVLIGGIADTISHIESAGEGAQTA